MRIYLAAALTVAIYLLYFIRPTDVYSAVAIIGLSLAAGFGLVASLIPVAGPVAYAEILAAAQAFFGLALPPPLYLVLTWLSFAMSAMSAVFLAMYFLQVGRWAAKRAFRFLLLW
ncbi:MAG: hypothetical protein QXP98_01780 [Thermoproteus sp.]